MKYLVCLLLLFTQMAYSECYIADSLKGNSSRAYNQFEITEDGFSGQKFKILLSGDQSKVVNSAGTFSEMSCTQIGYNTLVCLPKNRKPSQALIETWSVYPQAGKVVHTKSSSGYLSDGGNLFIGHLEGKCE